MTTTDMANLLAAAQRGDEQAFVALSAPHRRALHVHAYKMLGCLHDADDALQETLLRAWRALPSFEPRAALSTWLHRIATNVCLRMIEQRARHGVAHLQPYPDRLFDWLPADDHEASPETRALAREGIGLAYVAAMQHLPARPRAVVVLRDGLGWSAAAVADQLGDSVASVTSALQRARATLDRERAAGTLAAGPHARRPAAETAVMRAFLDAWEAVDVPRIVALTMPPMELRFDGPEAIGVFFATQPAGGDLARIRHVEVAANGQPALASYREDDDAHSEHEAYGVMVFAIAGDRISGITGFPHDLEAFTQLGLPHRT